MTDECVELKNIKYQNMLLNKNSLTSNSKENVTNMDTFLEFERTQDKKKPWSKLEKAKKLKKLAEFAMSYPTKHHELLKQYLFVCLNRKKLQRTKDVVYDISSGKITKIPGLSFNKIKNKYTLKRADRGGSTLKGLAPKKTKKVRKTKTQKKNETKN